jgi:hypothetical protein
VGRSRQGKLRGRLQQDLVDDRLVTQVAFLGFAGPLTVNGDNEPSNANNNIGFRCAILSDAFGRMGFASAIGCPG